MLVHAIDTSREGCEDGRAAPVVIVAFPDVQILDVTGPLEVFSMANRLAGAPPPYAVRVVAPKPGAVRTSSGVGLVAARSLGQIRAPSTP